VKLPEEVDPDIFARPETQKKVPPLMTAPLLPEAVHVEDPTDVVPDISVTEYSNPPSAVSSTSTLQLAAVQ
jgi:hypothetical protein